MEGREDSKGTPLPEIINEVINIIGTTVDEYDRIRKRIERICKEISIEGGNKNLWEATKHKGRYIFTNEQKMMLYLSDGFKRLIYESPSLEGKPLESLLKDWPYYQNTDEANKRIKAFETRNIEDTNGEHFSQQGFSYVPENLERIKINMMVEALFSVFFTEFDEEKLKLDLWARYVVGTPQEETADTIAAEKRLKHPLGNYFERRLDNK